MSEERPWPAWRVLASRPLVRREPWLTVWEEDVALPNGIQIAGYLRACTRDYAMTFALLENGTAPLVRQYKHGLGEPSYDLPAGYLESQLEEPLAAAQRELREETGLTAAEWRLLGHFVLDSNRGPGRAHCYLATGCRMAGPQELDTTEALEVSYHTPAELRSMVLNGAIDSLATVATIMAALQVMRQ